MQTPNKQTTITTISNKKNKEKITMITAYDALFAKIFDGEVDMILVGDSLHMSFFGAKDTLGISLEAMIYHTKAVCNATKQSLVVCDMPFGSTATPQNALESAISIYKNTDAHAVKLEIGKEGLETIRLLVENGIAVMAHIGLKPQFVRSHGGYKIQGKSEQDTQTLIALAKDIEKSGAFSILLEGVVAKSAESIAKSVKIPVIGIGSGVNVDGQVLVWSDAFGFFEEFQPKFVRRYLQGAYLIRDALREFVKDVKDSRFPNSNESY